MSKFYGFLLLTGLSIGGLLGSTVGASTAKSGCALNGGCDRCAVGCACCADGCDCCNTGVCVCDHCTCTGACCATK